MASVPFVGTLESDDDVDQLDNESDSEEEPQKPVKRAKTKKRDRSLFEADFQFFSGELDEHFEDPWNLDVAIKFAKQKQESNLNSSSLQDKITKRRETRRKKKSNKENEQNKAEAEEEENCENEEKHEELDSVKEDGEESIANTILPCDELESSSEEDEITDKITEKKRKFFEEPPPQVMHQSFTTMNLSRPLLKAINDLGFSHPTPIQASTIPVALMGKDICACAATGTGKTAAYMLPILERLIYRPQQVSVTRVLILTPTRELAIQIHSVTKTLSKHTNIQVCLATGGLDGKSQEAALCKAPDIVIATPGRLVDHLHNTPSFSLQTVEIIVLDEADRMLDENFEDQMQEVMKLSPRGRQTMLFSATMTDEVEELVSLSLNQPVRLFVDNNTDVAHNLRQEFVRIRSNREDDRLAIITALCSRTFNEHCLIFLQTKTSAHRLRIILGLLGLNVEELHGNLTQLQRLEALRKFKAGEVDILVATDLASRGLDILGVKTVINANLPPTLKQYIHRVGRTARAGRSGRSVSLVGEKERKLLKEIVKLAKTPVKSRIVPTEVIDKYKIKIQGLEKDVKEILKQESEEKEVFMSLVKKKTGQSNSGFIYANQSKGKPIKLMSVSQPQTGSSSASSSTLKKRSQVIEKFVESVASATKVADDVIHQTATSIKRKKDQFLKSFSEGGLNIIQSFTLKQVAELKAHMPMEMLRMIKRTFRDALGYDIFGSEKEIRGHLKSMEFEYECGNFESSTGEDVSFVRVADVSDVVKKSVNELNESGFFVEKSNIPKNLLWVLLTGDKGGKSTKLLMQFLNCKEQHSIKTARLLAIFEGDKDNYQCIQKVFGPVIEETKKVLSNITELDLKVDLTESTSPSKQPNFEIRGMANWPKELQELFRNCQNEYHSQRCLLCQKTAYFNSHSSNYDANKPSSASYSISEFWLSLGGDWEFIARLLGLTGPNGTFFCNFCHAQLKDLEKGKPHTPWLLHQGATASHIPTKKFPVRSFESILSDNDRFVKGGSVKSKVNQFHNCESTPVYQATGSVIDSVSCMPLHLSLGLGKQALELVEREAISLDNTIKEANGEASPELVEAFQKREELILDCANLEELLENDYEAINSTEEKLQRFLAETAPCHQKEGRRFTTHTVEAVKARERARELKKGRDEQQHQAKQHQDQLKAAKEQLTNVVAKIHNLKGPFQKRLDGVLERMNLKRQVYHKGALVGNDVAKILHPENIGKIVNCFKPLRVNLQNGEHKVFSDQRSMNKVSTLLTKLSQCFQLYSPSTPLLKGFGSS